ncbi:hypothetical protein [Pseudanabaena sp. PCC 6802]|uniref:hypothetical protein n=1 Tax=Pseudanabaena sp. PCC 6802 TaxID=118173 RepID=UPI00034B388F|nr:hypothetical protein [Pseudanabaena sp. PCC 6802]
MLELNTFFHNTFHHIGDFSRNNCVSICAFLVPANMLATLQTMILVALSRPATELRWTISASILYAAIMVLHVFSWFIAGVVMAPTFILLFLGSVCLGLNVWAIAHPESMARLLRSLVTLVLPSQFNTNLN